MNGERKNTMPTSDLFYVEQGSGEPLILLHGNGEDHTYFEHQIRFFSSQYRVIALDTRGHGKSPRGDRRVPFTISQFAEDLCEFMNAHGIPRAHILGFSDGANIALTFALKYPQKVKKMILNGANLDPSGVKAHVQFPIVLGYRVASLFARKKPGALQNAEMLRLMVEEPNIKPEQLSRLTMPTLVIAGTQDMIKTKHTQLISDSLPHAELVLLDGDHFIANRKPEAFNEEVARFLKKSEEERS